MDVERQIIGWVEAFLWERNPEKREELALLIYRAIVPKLIVTIRGEVYESEVDEVLSVTLEAIFNNFHKVRIKSDAGFRGWCHKVALHKSIDQRRRRKKNEDFETFCPKEIEASVLATLPEDAAAFGRKLDCEWAVKCLKKLRPYCRNALWKHFMDELDFEDLEIILKKDFHAVRMQVVRCVQELFRAYHES